MKNQELTDFILAEERTLLAAERTFSAWLRTAISAMAGGLAILRFISFKTEFHKIIGHIIGETLILWGFVVLILASIDYRKTHKKLTIATNAKSSALGFFILVIPLLIIATLLLWITLP